MPRAAKLEQRRLRIEARNYDRRVDDLAAVEFDAGGASVFEYKARDTRLETRARTGGFCRLGERSGEGAHAAFGMGKAVAAIFETPAHGVGESGTRRTRTEAGAQHRIEGDGAFE